MQDGYRTVIESLGVYLPPKEVTTKEILRACKQKIFLPLQRLTGIKSRRMAGDDEFAIDLAERAIIE
ncbi:MAG: 3-oxoacyl-[acyl-carrier-protein] synthase III, partial [Rhodothermales bacterium]